MNRLADNIYTFKGKVEDVENDYIINVQEKLKAYEDKQEQGLLIELPCKVGDTVYLPAETNGECKPYIDVGTVFAIGINEKHTMWISVSYESGLKYYHTSDDFGKRVFFTRFEAEEALEKMGGK